MNVEQYSGYSLRDMFHVLFKRKWLILSFTVITSLVGSAITIATQQTLYEATAQILLSPGREHVTALSITTGAVPPRVTFDLEEQSARSIEMLTGRFLADQVVQTLGARNVCRETMRWPVPVVSKKYCDPALEDNALSERAVGQLLENVHAERIGSAALVNVSFRHRDPEMAAKVVNTLGALYLERHLGVLRNPRTEAFVQEQAEVLKTRVVQAEGDLQSFRQRNSVNSSIKEEREAIGRQLAMLEAEQNELRSRQADIGSRAARRRGQYDDSGAGVDSAAQDKLRDLETREHQLAIRLGDSNPELIALREQVSLARDEVAQQRTQHYKSELAAVNARVAAHQPAIAEAKHRLQLLDRLEPEFDRLLQRAQSEEQNYRLYIAKAEEARVSHAMDEEKIASVRVIEPARTPKSSLPSKLSARILVCIAFGVLGALLIAFGLELFSDRLETTERVESLLQLPLLASIPIMPEQ
jgi:uncharacterized protein involved in exopolysaccharide biosynthesis